MSEGGMRVYEREESEETEAGEESNPEREREEEAEEGVSFGEILRALRRSRVRTEILMYLYKIYPNASYPAEISRNTGIDPTNILGGLRGMGSRFDEANSLLKLGLVEKIERGNATYYRISERGKAFIESLKM
ncbi:MAG: putative transcriptional regulator [Canidatus Methanoxibalbensis ujae]|nr:putative transcriptional regulator [Candidatus Methanoxibalbensis ujae]MCW7077757.1 putative transcriptional regulator [Candidatus Methanoxibalbensis ujae]